MVRTKGDTAVTKVVGAKAPRKQLVGTTSASTSSPSDAKKRLPSTGLPYCPQPTPEWQKSVRSFFSFTPKDNENKENQVDADIVAIDEISDNNTSKKSRKGKGPKKGKKVVKKSTPSEEDNHQPMEEVENDKNDNTEKAIGKMRRNGVIDSDEDDD